MKGIKGKIQRALRDVRWEIEQWILKYAPRDTGRLQASLIFSMHHGVDFKNFPFTFKIGAPVPYASYVADMRGVNWTNPNTRDDWWPYLQELIKLRVEAALQQVLRQKFLTVK
jgi:hypothetical protein